MSYPDLFILYVMSIMTFVLFAWDKHLACVQKKQGSRAIAASLLTIGRRVRGFVCHDIL